VKHSHGHFNYTGEGENTEEENKFNKEIEFTHGVHPYSSETRISIAESTDYRRCMTA
jgi:formylmethanofuran dehydrogenase subunit B